MRVKTLEKITFWKNEKLGNIFNKFNKHYCDQIKDDKKGTLGCCHVAVG
jgi:hypothetical protein